MAPLFRTNQTLSLQPENNMADNFDVSESWSWGPQLRDNCTLIPDDFVNKFLSATGYRQIGVSATYGVICVAGLLANAFVLFLLFSGGKRGATFRAPSTILILNLVVADILLLLTLPFSISHRLDNRWKFGDAMCKFEEGVKFLNYYGSVFFLTAMAVDRYFVVSRPGYHNRKTARRSLCLTSACLWILALIAVIPLLIFAKVDEHGHCSIMFPRGPTAVGNVTRLLEALNEVGCLEDYLYDGDETYKAGASDIIYRNSGEDAVPGSGSVKDYVNFIDNSMGLDYDESGLSICKHPDIRSLHIWLIWNFVIGFVVPFFFISLSYARIMMLRLPAQQRPQTDRVNRALPKNGMADDVNKLMNVPEKRNKFVNRRAKALMNVLVPILVAVFAICWFPYHFFHLLQIRGVAMRSELACHVIRDVTFCLAFFNSALNPMLNSFFLYNFKNLSQDDANETVLVETTLIATGRENP